MTHFATPDFWQHYHALPEEIRTLADKNYTLLRTNPFHASLHFKKIKADVWSVRVGRHYRALAFEGKDGYDWFWTAPMPNTTLSSPTYSSDNSDSRPTTAPPLPPTYRLGGYAPKNSSTRQH